MSFNPAKSLSLVLKYGRLVEKIRFTVSEETIPTLTEKPVKILRKEFDCTSRDTTTIHETIKDLAK